MNLEEEKFNTAKTAIGNIAETLLKTTEDPDMVYGLKLIISIANFGVGEMNIDDEEKYKPIKI